MSVTGPSTAPVDSDPVTIVTQTQVRPEFAEAFARWQDDTSKVIAGFDGFLEQKVIPPNPPQQVDWVILQRFARAQKAVAWLNSPDRLHRVEGAAPMLMGRDDVHLVKDGGQGVLPAPVSAVISTHIKPGREPAYRRWEQRIAAAQTRARGFQGYRFEPPIPGVQEDWLSILRFDNEENLQAWLDSPERKALLAEASDFTEEFHARVVRTGFDQWFPSTGGPGAPRPAAWKQNMIVLLLLYPVVFLFGNLVQTPLLVGKASIPFSIALFIGNAFSITVLNYLVPWTSQRFGWWLSPSASAPRRTALTGTVVIAAIYAFLLLVFTLVF